MKQFLFNMVLVLQIIGLENYFSLLKGLETKQDKNLKLTFMMYYKS